MDHTLEAWQIARTTDAATRAHIEYAQGAHERAKEQNVVSAYRYSTECCALELIATVKHYLRAHYPKPSYNSRDILETALELYKVLEETGVL